MFRDTKQEASWSLLRAEHLREHHTAIKLLCEENRALERRAASADKLRETVMRPKAEVEVAHAECEAWCAPRLFLYVLHFGANFVEFRAMNAVPETVSATHGTCAPS